MGLFEYMSMFMLSDGMACGCSFAHCYLGRFYGTPHEKNVMFVIAHPDDESMFFSPTINYLTANAYKIHILCLSTGNADGIGIIRKDELHQACAVLRVNPVCLRRNLCDGFGQVWNHDLLSEIIKEEVTNHDIHTIITFDSYGVSGHCNHRGVVKFLQTNSERNIKAWELVSLNFHYSQHSSQWVWFRKLFVSFSSYTYTNILQRINP
ncbi:hypothetical protein Bca52824_077654 [Brassica carinata]|uniref:N-acetylglucosaminylphosphatidylinositol deacetylase n=1 Tax=Brassica carinata TaxID=52824 RepID=A0A8X7TXG9_BRACI|nr:hypothetical protein Bca52824_077654 [Brassica carinata]